MPFPGVFSTAGGSWGALGGKGPIKKPMFLPLVVESYCLPYSEYYTPTSSVHTGVSMVPGSAMTSVTRWGPQPPHL